MALERARSVIDDYATTTRLIHRHVDGLTDRESLLQPPFETNCLNWVLGHVIWRRQVSLDTLAFAGIWDDDLTAVYGTGSEPLLDPSRARAFSALVQDLGASQAKLADALSRADDLALDKVVANDRGEKPAIEHLRGFHWHETYHVGQMELLRAFILSCR